MSTSSPKRASPSSLVTITTAGKKYVDFSLVHGFINQKLLTRMLHQGEGYFRDAFEKRERTDIFPWYGRKFDKISV